MARPGRKGGPGRRRACQDRRPGLCRLFAVTRLTATGRVADAPIPASPGRSGLCLRNPVTLIDGAMHWAADHDGSPLADVCEGNPGRLFSGQGYVPVSMACSAWLLPRTRRRRNPSTLIDGAMYWQPTMMEARRRTCARGIRVGPGLRRRSGATGCRAWQLPRTRRRRNPSTLIDGAMYWQPTMMEARRRTCARGIRVGPGLRRRSGATGCRAWQLPRTCRSGHEALRLQGKDRRGPVGAETGSP